MSNTILFGGSGFLGPIILEQYPEIISVGRTAPPSYVKNRHIPLPTLDDIKVLDELGFDKVIFLIGNSNHHMLNLSPIMVALDYNMTPLIKILSYLQQRQIKKLVCFTGALLYDVQESSTPVDETQPINPYRNNYLFSKFLAEEVTKLYAEKVPTITVRLSNIYGPTKLIRPDLVPTLIQSALSPHETTIWNTAPVRDFIYAADAAEAILKLLETDYTGIINLGSGMMHSVEKVAKIVAGLSGKDVRNLGKPVSGPIRFCLDITRIAQLTGWQPRHCLEEGLAHTYSRMKVWAEEYRWWEHNGSPRD